MKTHTRTRTLQQLVTEFVSEIERGTRLRPGDRLPPQRMLARERGVAASTVSQAYRELTRRGLVIGETGRGTYVRAPAAPASTALTEPTADTVDLALNVPLLPEQARLLADSLAPLLRRTTAFEAALRPVEAIGTPAVRKTTATFIARAGWRADPDRLVFAGSGKQALNAVVSALVRPGERLATDALTYPLIKAIAARIPVELVPIAMDEEGMRADALAAAHLRRPVRAVYIQPTLHNPLGTTMTARRRAELIRVLKRHDLIAIEDAVYAFLAPDVPPLTAQAPDRIVLIDSLSKRLAPGLTIGIVIAPAPLADRITTAIRTNAHGPTGVALTACTHWMTDGTATTIATAKRRDAMTRQRLLRKTFPGPELQSDPHAYHAWLTLPASWRAQDFESAAAHKRIAVVPGSTFAVTPGHSPNAIRLALASPTLETLATALTTLATLMQTR